MKVSEAVDQALVELAECGGLEDQEAARKALTKLALAVKRSDTIEREVLVNKCSSCGETDVLCVKCLVGEQALDMAKMAWPMLLPKVLAGVQTWWARRQARLDAEARAAAAGQPRSAPGPQRF